MQPGRESGVPLESLEILEGRQERFLDRIPRILLVAEESSSRREEAPAVIPDELLEGGFVAGTQASDQLGVEGWSGWGLWRLGSGQDSLRQVILG